MTARTSAVEELRSRFEMLPFILACVALLCLCHAAYYLLVGIAQPVVSWRETQTALSAYWLWREGPRLAYETPVLGAPWAIPFEFPLYQYLIAGLRWLGVSIEVGGRLLSFAFFVATLAPLWILLKELRFKPETFLIVAILFLSAPICISVSRAVFIETTAVFFSVLWLAFIALYLNRSGTANLGFALAAGCVAMLVKATTLPAYGVIAACLILATAVMSVRNGTLRPKAFILIGAMAGGIIPLLAGYAWTRYADLIKSANPIGIRLTSTALWTWSFGPWEQRFGAGLWRDTILNRALPDILGNGFAVALLSAGTTLTSRNRATMTMIAIAAFLAPLVTFTNLYIVNPYYSMANALLCVAVVGLGISHLIDCRRPLLATGLLAIMLISQLGYFHRHYAADITADLRQDPLIRTAQLIKNHTNPDSAILVFGKDWMPALSYLSERKSLTMPGWIPHPVFDRLMSDPQSLLGGRALGVIVWCRGESAYELTAHVDQFVAGRELIADAGDCKLLSPSR